MGVRFENVAKRFGDVVAVDNLNLEVPTGELLILLGPSGCGKTTALRMLAGLETTSSGTIYVDERPVNTLHAKDRDIAMVFQNYALYPHMTVYQNLSFPLEAKKTPKEERDRRIQEVAKMLGIETLLKRKPKQISGGQAQRVALGRSIVRHPKVFLMDEPLSNVDAKQRVQMRVELQKLHKRLNTTTLYVTHDQEEAMTIGERLAVMNEGVLQQHDTPFEVYNHPANIFVATFIGSPAMNVFPARPTESEGRSGLLVGDSLFFEQTGQLFHRLAHVDASELLIGARPEHVKLARHPSGNSVETQVDVVELVGRELHVYCTALGQTVASIVPADSDFRSGEKVWLGFHEEHLHFFDTKSTQRLF